jgi:hypothetical protein
MQRVSARTGDASDATPEVLRRQLATPPGALTWRMIDVSGAPEGVAAQARGLLGLP